MIKENGYLKCFFNLENISCLFIMSGINFFNNHTEMMGLIFFIFNSAIVAEYIKLSNIMRQTRRKIFKDIILGSLITGTVYCLCVLGISKVLNLESILGNDGLLGIIQIIGMYLLSGLLGVRIGIFISNNLKMGKKFIFKLSILCALLAGFIVLCITLTNLFQLSNSFIWSNYTGITNILLIFFICIISILIIFNIRKNIFKLEWN